MKKILMIGLVMVVIAMMGCSFGATGVKWQNQEQIATPKTDVVYYEVRFYERGAYIWNKVTSEPLKSKPDEFMLKFTESFINKLGDDFKKAGWSLKKVDEAIDKKILPIYIEMHIASDTGTFYRAPMGAVRWNIYYAGIKQKEIYE